MVAAHRRHMHPPRRDHALSIRLDREWRAICRRPGTVERARAWGVTDEPIADLDELLERAGFRTAPSAVGHEVLRRLVDVARDDELAARVVLQRILPGLLADRPAAPPGRRATFDDVVGAAWLAIRGRRPPTPTEQVAANLVRGAAYRAFTGAGPAAVGERGVGRPADARRGPPTSAIGPCEELATLLAEARADGHRRRPTSTSSASSSMVGSPGRVAACAT